MTTLLCSCQGEWLSPGQMLQRAGLSVNPDVGAAADAARRHCPHNQHSV